MVQQKNLSKVIGKIFTLSIILMSCNCNDKSLLKTPLQKKIAKDSIYILNGIVSDYDTAFIVTKENMGIGDDGIYNIQEPIFSSSVSSKPNYSIMNITDWDLKKAFVFNTDSVKKALIFCEFNFSEYPKRKDTLFQIDNEVV